MSEDNQDEMWLSHLWPNENKWIALAGDYPFSLVGVGSDAVEALEVAKQRGHPVAKLFKVPFFRASLPASLMFRS